MSSRGKSDYLIFLNSTEARYRMDTYPEVIMPESVKDLMRKMLVVDCEKRATIE